MGESEVGIALRRIVLADDGVARKIEKQASVLSEVFLEHCREAVLPGNLVDDQVGADPQATAPVGFRSFLRENRSGKVDLVVLIGIHQRGILFADLADDRPLGDVELAGRVIDPPILKQHKGGPAFLFDGDLAFCIGDCDGEIVIHAASCTSLTVTLIIVQDQEANCNRKSPDFVVKPSFMHREFCISEV
ncbi:MAG: hypothetical protein M0P41_04950 [Sphaerochaeta sp.]|nr:hypothetical protein [Sphaerochaeta sp.]